MNTVLRLITALPLAVRAGLFLLLLALGGQPVLAQTPNPLTCNTTSYLFQSDNTNVYEINLASGSYTQMTQTGITGIPANSDGNKKLNAIGFNQVDNYIWAQVYGTSQIARIGKDASGNYLGQAFSVNGLVTPTAYSVGDVSPKGKMYLALGGSNANTLIYVVDLTASSSALTATTITTTASYITDWAVSPVDNNLYAISSNVNGNAAPAAPVLYRFLTAARTNADGTTTPIGTRETLGQPTGITTDKNGNSNTYNFGSAFMDANGDFYGVLNGTGSVYRVSSPDKLPASTTATPTATYITTLNLNTSNTDGARCSAAKIVPLPVTLTSFTAAAAPSRSVQLRWTTASEQNNDFFEVQHSTDGQAFAAVGRVAGHQTTAQASAYAFVDATPGAATTHYYRLRQVDLDGSSVWSPVQVVSLADAAPGQLSVAPNPSTADGLRVQVQCAAPTTAVLEIRSLLGQCVFRQTLTLAAGSNQLALSTQLAPGPYWLSLAGATDRTQGVKVFITN